MHHILTRLSQGDRRTIGAADSVAKEIIDHPPLFAVVFQGLYSLDPGLRMRCADALEKASRKHPTLLIPHKAELLSGVSGSEQQEVQWYIAQMIVRLTLTPREHRQAAQLMETYFDHSKSNIVRTNALQALVELAAQERQLQEHVWWYLKKASKDRAPSVQTRARKLMKANLI